MNNKLVLSSFIFITLAPNVGLEKRRKILLQHQDTKNQKKIGKFLHRFAKKKLHREHGTEEKRHGKAFNAFKCEVERNNRYLVEQLLQKINKIEVENNEKIEAIEKKCKQIENQYKIEIERLMMTITETYKIWNSNITTTYKI